MPFKKQATHHWTEHNLHQFKFFHLHGIEKFERMVRITMCDMTLHDNEHANIRYTALLSFDNYPDIKALDDDENDGPQVFDIILTNPPFGSLMGGEIGNILGRFELCKGKNLFHWKFSDWKVAYNSLSLVAVWRLFYRMTY